MNKLKTEIFLGDSRIVLKNFPDGYFHLIVTSPPYADARKRHYDSIKPDNYAEFIISFHEELWRVLADNGSFILNIKDKVVNGVRHRFVWQTIEALSKKGWLSIDDYLWVKTNAMPGYWKNRLRDEWEYCFQLTKHRNFVMYQDAVMKPIGNWVEKRLAKLNGKSNERHNSENNSGFGRDLRNWKNKNTVLPGNTIIAPLVGKNMGHPAAFPEAIPEFFMKLFTKEGDNVLDPFAGSGTTGVVADKLNRNAVLIDNKIEYVNVIRKRLKLDEKDENVLFDCKLREYSIHL
ncbi:MAG: site-specific DNA-methyltransferase [Candidatus Omnitrophota bacterium]